MGFAEERLRWCQEDLEEAKLTLVPPSSLR